MEAWGQTGRSDHGGEKCQKTSRLSLDFHGINLGDRYE
jgi:hypothetical protein